MKILYFARIREKIGIESEEMDVELKDVSELVFLLKNRGEKWKEALKSGTFRVAVNQEMARFETPLRKGDEVAIFPPVTGG